MFTAVEKFMSSMDETLTALQADKVFPTDASSNDVADICGDARTTTSYSHREVKTPPEKHTTGKGARRNSGMSNQFSKVRVSQGWTGIISYLPGQFLIYFIAWMCILAVLHIRGVQLSWVGTVVAPTVSLLASICMQRCKNLFLVCMNLFACEYGFHWAFFHLLNGICLTPMASETILAASIATLRVSDAFLCELGYVDEFYFCWQALLLGCMRFLGDFFLLYCATSTHQLAFGQPDLFLVEVALPAVFLTARTGLTKYVSKPISDVWFVGCGICALAWVASIATPHIWKILHTSK